MKRPNVVILGGGFAGLETAFYLRHAAGRKLDLTLVSDDDHFLYRPNTIYIPFGTDPATLRIPLSKPALRKDIELLLGRATAIDTERCTVSVGSKEISYDYLVVATGAALRAEEIPGLGEHALTLWTIDEMLRLREKLQSIVEGDKSQLILFLVPPNNRCSGPLYEMALMVDTWLRREGARRRVFLSWATYEEAYLKAFGPRVNALIHDEFVERGIRGRKRFVVNDVGPFRVRFRNGRELPYDILVSFPPYVAKEQFSSLPTDDRGFIQVDPESRRVKGIHNVFAVGDAADFPVKQAFSALLQADATAEHLAAEVLGRAPDPRMRFEPMSMCVLDELNRAAFVQIPMMYTSNPESPVNFDVGDMEHYKVGVSPLWRVGKRVLGLYLPWRFGRGEPFHAGLGWEVMERGLAAMSRVLAD